MLLLLLLLHTFTLSFMIHFISIFLTSLLHISSQFTHPGSKFSLSPLSPHHLCCSNRGSKLPDPQILHTRPYDWLLTASLTLHRLFSDVSRSRFLFGFSFLIFCFNLIWWTKVFSWEVKHLCSVLYHAAAAAAAAAAPTNYYYYYYHHYYNYQNKKAAGGKTWG